MEDDEWLHFPSSLNGGLRIESYVCGLGPFALWLCFPQPRILDHKEQFCRPNPGMVPTDAFRNRYLFCAISWQTQKVDA